MRRFLVSLTVFLFALTLLAPAVADAATLEEMKPQIIEEMEILKRHLKEDNVPGALESNGMIDAWLREVQASEVSNVFQEIPGWEMERGDSEAAGAAFFGGGISASCVFTKGDEKVTVKILGNSPMFGMVSGMMGMAAAAGKKVKRIAGNKAILDDSNGKADLQIPCDGNTLVSANGTSVASVVMVAEKGVGWDALSRAVAQ